MCVWCVWMRLAHAEQWFTSLCVRGLHKEVSDWNPSCPLRTHAVHGKCNRAHRSVGYGQGFPSAPVLCFPVRFAQVDLPPTAHLNGTRPLTPPHLTVLRVKAFFNSSRPPSVAANGGICYCQLIWPPLHTDFFLLFLARCFCFAASLCSGFAI